ncbi:MAG: DUF1540 domain-containing protein [Eubacteriales bacterium]|nr:DUF1540 domain-containing protein [Eubacteriales bacterium]MDD4475421.1 DUF1540 domain-containing protein [Eubacteriales bacterium]
MEGIYLDGNDRREHIERISCSVRNCVYHDGELHCTAKRISVGTTAATSCGETMCATFKPRTNTIG